MEPPECGVAAMRRGSYDDAAASLRPHFRNLAQRRRSAPSLVFGKALGMPWSPIREEASCWVSVDQSPFVHGLTSENGELLLDECVQVTEGSKTRERHLFLFRDVIVFAKIKSTSSYRLKQRVRLEDVWLHGFEDELEDYEEGATGDADLRVTLVLAWELSVCLVCFCSPEVKERWLDTLHRKINYAKARAGCASSPPDVLMKVLSGSVATKTLTGGGMEQFIEFQLDGNAKIPKPLSNQEDRPAPPIDGKWNPLRRLKKGQSFTSKGGQSDAKTPKLFGQALGKICPDPCALPKPVSEMLLLLRKRGPSAEGVFRKPCNSKNMREVREKLNGGLEVDMESQPVTLLVGLLKSFLKELPGSLLVSELYDGWVAALDAQQRGAGIRSMVDKLPAANRLLLQHLLCVFLHILESSDVNKMDAYNLAVCIGPTLLQLDATPLDEQKEKTQKVTELTQFLIENYEILGENIPNLLDTDEDSLSSQHHDSAYDSTDPDGDGEAGESSTLGGHGSSSSLSPSIAASTWSSDAALSTKSPFNRRCSEPIIHLTPDVQCLQGGHARSHDDCSMASGLAFKDQPLTKQISDDSFLLRGRRLSFPKLCASSNLDPMLYSSSQTKDCSCSSLESAASNQSEGSVFSSSPVGSPPSSKKANSDNAMAGARAALDSARPNPDEKKRSQSMRVASKVLLRTRSLGAFSRSSLKRESQKDFPCETLQEDSVSEADPAPEHKPRPLSAIEVFKQADSRLPSRPPSYEQAVNNAYAPRRMGSMTVHDAIRLERRSRPSSLNYDRPPTCAVNQYADCFGAQESACASEQRVTFRQRAMSESVSAGHHEAVSRRCSQPVFEEFSYAKESYV